MSFTVVFPHEGDTCYLAHCYPYRYSDMMLDLANIRADPVRLDIFSNLTNIFLVTNVSNRFRSKCISQKVLCQTLAGNEVPLLTITSPSCVADTKNKQGEPCRGCSGAPAQ